MKFVITAKPIEWIPSERYWEESRYGFTITYDTDSKEYSAAWGEGDDFGFESLDDAQQWCQDTADEWIGNNALVTQMDKDLLTIPNFLRNQENLAAEKKQQAETSPADGQSRLTGGLGAELERELRAAINPLYEDMRGTESYERKRLLGEIDALRADADEIEGLRWDNAKLRPFVEQMARQNGDVYFQSLAKAALSPDVPPENVKGENNVTHT